MAKNLVIFMCLVLYSTEIFATFDFITKFIDGNDANVTRVRTPNERDQRWREFAVLDFIGLVEQFSGYTAEEYDVQTKDGYILKLHRISGSPFSPKRPGKPVVYLGQCLFGSSDLYVLTGAKHALAFQLADAGYDVWIGNFRGNTYSKRHTKYSSSTSNYKFWNFSMDEISLIDLPLLIDTVLAKTNERKLSYIGYSMGATVIYMLLSEMPEYNNIMNVVINITPVVTFTPPFSPLVNTMLTMGPFVKSIAVSNRIYQILPQSKLIQIFGKDICTTDYGRKLCGNFMSALLNVKFLNMTALPTLVAHMPAGASLNTIEHYIQMIRSGKFRRYDFGTRSNNNKYHTPEPPEYDLTKISSPQAIFYSGDDVYVSVKDTNKLRHKLQNVVAFEKSPDGFNHLDFMWHQGARKFVYNRVLEVLARHL